MLKQIERVMEVDNTEALKSVLSSILSTYDIPYFLYGMRIPQINKKTKDLIVTVYPNGWMEHYMKEQYIEVDSVLHYSLNNNLPIIWEDKIFESSKRMREESLDIGLQFGISFPIHSITGENGLLSIASPVNGSVNNETFMMVSSILPYVHEKIKELERHNRFFPTLPELTKKELEILRWTAIGKTAFEISCIISLSERTVVYHLTNVMKKFQCNNKGQAVAFALTHKIISL